MAKKYNAWKVKFGLIEIRREKQGMLNFSRSVETILILTPRETRSLFQKLSADYRD